VIIKHLQQHLNGSEQLLSRKNVIKGLWVVLNSVGFQVNILLLHLHLLLLQLLQLAIIIFLLIWFGNWKIYLISLSLVDMGLLLLPLPH
jgi:hypothetical protein